MATLQDLDMLEAANFDSDEACQYLAQLIDTALALKLITIRGQIGERMVKLNVDYEQGSIKVANRRDRQVICERATQRTKTNEVTISY